MELYGVQDLEMVIMDINDYEETDDGHGFEKHFQMAIMLNEKQDTGIKKAKPRGVWLDCIKAQMTGDQEYSNHWSHPENEENQDEKENQQDGNEDKKEDD